jgi:hypothetical protein
LHIVAIFWLSAVELDIFDMCDHLVVLPLVVSRDIQRFGGSPFQSVNCHAQKLFSIALGWS